MADAVLFVAGTDPLQDHGGMPAYVRAHLRAATRVGFHPHLFCASGDSGSVETDFGTVHRVRSPWCQPRGPQGFRHWQSPLHVPLLTRALDAFVSREPARAYLIHSFAYWGVVGQRVARRAGARGQRIVPVCSVFTTLTHEFEAKLRGVQQLHGWKAWTRAALDFWMIRWIVVGYEREGYRGARLVLVNYDSVRRLLAAELGALSVRHIAYASEAAFVHDPGRAAAKVLPSGRGEPPLIVAVSRHDPRKGVDVLLRALGRLRTAGFAFRACLVGGWDLLDAHRRLARQLGLGVETTITGPVADPHPYLCQADIFVLPSLQEASGSLSLLEALQIGVAVVASAVDGIPEDVVDGHSALLVPPGDPEALAVALGRLLHDGGLRDRLARAGHETFQARFSAPIMTSTLRDVYAELGFTAGA